MSQSRHEDSKVSDPNPTAQTGDPSSELEKQGWGEGDQILGLRETEAEKVGSCMSAGAKWVQSFSC